MPTDFGYTYTRDDWVNPLEPVTGPAPFPWVTADRIAIHYTAALNVIDGDPGENWAGIPAYLRAIHHDYLTNPARGYSIGYGIAVDQRGESWQLRGITWKNAANLNWNHRTLAILVLVDAADELRPPAVEAVRDIVAWFRQQSPFANAVQIVGHRDIGATACPGNGVYSQITSGVLEPLPPPRRGGRHARIRAGSETCGRGGVVAVACLLFDWCGAAVGSGWSEGAAHRCDRHRPVPQDLCGGWHPVGDRTSLTAGGTDG